jgi:hypothetical protein
MAGARWLARGVRSCSWPQGVKRAGRPLVAGADELGPATAVDEDVAERGAAQEAVVDRVNHAEEDAAVIARGSNADRVLGGERNKRTDLVGLSCVSSRSQLCAVMRSERRRRRAKRGAE